MDNPERNKSLVLEAFNTLFNERDYDKAERFWSPDYVQFHAQAAEGRDDVFAQVRSLPATLKYEPRLILAERDLVFVLGQLSGLGEWANWTTADVLRILDGRLVEHWDALEADPGALPWPPAAVVPRPDSAPSPKRIELELTASS